MVSSNKLELRIYWLQINCLFIKYLCKIVFFVKIELKNIVDTFLAKQLKKVTIFNNNSLSLKPNLRLKLFDFK